MQEVLDVNFLICKCVRKWLILPLKFFMCELGFHDWEELLMYLPNGLINWNLEVNVQQIAIDIQISILQNL